MNGPALFVRTLLALVVLLLAAACGGSSADSDKGHVYFMNNKSEVVDQYKQLAEMYTEKTGVQVDVQTGASGTYDATMSSELAKSNAPTMFNISGFDQFAKYPSTSCRTGAMRAVGRVSGPTDPATISRPWPMDPLPSGIE